MRECVRDTAAAEAEIAWFREVLEAVRLLRLLLRAGLTGRCTFTLCSLHTEQGRETRDTFPRGDLRHCRPDANLYFHTKAKVLLDSVCYRVGWNPVHSKVDIYTTSCSVQSYSAFRQLCL